MLVFLLIFSGICSYHFASAVIQNRPVRNYAGIEALGALEIIVDLNGKEGVVLEAADLTVLDRVDTIAVDGILHIRIRPSNQTASTDPVKITVNAIIIATLEASGAATFTVTQPLKSPNVQLIGRGASFMTLSVDTTVVRVQLSGSSVIDINGKAASVDVIAQGSSIFRGLHLETDSAIVSVEGTADADILVNTSLIGHVGGAGTMNYDGQAKVNVKTSKGGKFSHV